MKQIEITTRVLENLCDVSKNLSSKGFNIIRKIIIDDIYMCPQINIITKKDIPNCLKKSVLIRYRETNGEIHKALVYKNKVFDKNGTTLSEEKINLDIKDIDNAKLLFLALNFRELVRVKYNCLVYEKNGLELAFQDVEGLGLVLEYENLNDFAGASEKEIEATKENMLKEIKALGIKTTNEIDVKKSYELIEKSLAK